MTQLQVDGAYVPCKLASAEVHRIYGKACGYCQLQLQQASGGHDAALEQYILH